MEKNTLGYLWREVCDKYSENQMICDISKSRKCTYRQFYREVEYLAKGLIGLGIEKGEHIGLLSGNSLEWMKIFAAVTEIGGVLTMFNTSLGREQILSDINFSDVTYLFTDRNMIEKLSKRQTSLKDGVSIIEKEEKKIKRIFIIDSDEKSSYMESICNVIGRDNDLSARKNEIKEEDIATIQFTSGTTGVPKAVQLSHGAIVKDERRNAAYFSYSTKEKMLLTTPLFHVLGFTACALPIFICGASLYLLQKYSTTKVIETIKEEKCSAICGVPTIYKFLCNKCRENQISSLDFALIAGSFCSIELIRNIFCKLGIKRLENYYGQSETITIAAASYSPFNSGKEKGFYIMDGIEYKIIDPKHKKILEPGVQGELAIRSETVMTGYYKNDFITNKTIQNGWVYTGDIAVADSTGKIYIKGRMGDTIIRGGENISAMEVEEQIRCYPLVKAVTVIGIPDAVYGQEVCAFIIPKEKQSFTIEDLEAYLWNKRGYKIPKYIYFVDKFPCTVSGKIQKYKLVQKYIKKEENKEDENAEFKKC